MKFNISIKGARKWDFRTVLLIVEVGHIHLMIPNKLVGLIQP